MSTAVSQPQTQSTPQATAASQQQAQVDNALVRTAAAWSKLDPRDLKVDDFVAAAQQVAPLYDIFFGGGSIGGMLKKDIVNHTEQVAALSSRHPEEKNLLSLAQLDLNERGVDKVRFDRSATGGARGLLWLMRAISFIAEFMDELAAQDKLQVSPNELARDAYSKTLKQNHAWALSSIVGAAFSVVPSRDQLLKKFEVGSNDVAQAELKRTAETMLPTTQAVLQWYKDHGYDWPEKAGQLF